MNKDLLNDALESMQNNNPRIAKAKLALFLESTRHDRNPAAEMTLDDVRNFTSVYNTLAADKHLNGTFDNVIREGYQKIRNNMMQLDADNAALPPMPKPQPPRLQDNHDQLAEQLLQKYAIKPNDYANLQKPSQQLLLATLANKEAEEMQKQNNPQMARQFKDFANNNNEQLIVDQVNKVLDNAKNEIGITKLGATTSVILHGEMHGLLGGAIDDVKSQVTNDLHEHLGTTIDDLYDTFKQDIINDDKYFDQLDATQKQMDDLRPRPEPSARNELEEEEQHELPSQFSTAVPNQPKLEPK